MRKALQGSGVEVSTGYLFRYPEAKSREMAMERQLWWSSMGRELIRV